MYLTKELFSFFKHFYYEFVYIKIKKKTSKVTCNNIKSFQSINKTNNINATINCNGKLYIYKKTKKIVKKMCIDENATDQMQLPT